MVWSLVRRQHGVVTHAQLSELGLTSRAIKHRLASGRLHRVHRGVYAVGRPALTQYGRWMAAVLSCGPRAALSHHDAAALWDICAATTPEIHVSVPFPTCPRSKGLAVHRRTELDVTSHRGIPVTTPIHTLIDIAAKLHRGALEAAINEADKLDLVDPEGLRRALDDVPKRPGVGVLREVLDHRTFVLTESELERRFAPIARATSLPKPTTGAHVNGFKVDFFWPELGLVVETDGLSYHRTPAQQARDRRRDQAHTAAGLTCLRFTHAQVRYEPAHVRATLEAVARRLR